MQWVEKGMKLQVLDVERCVGCQLCMFACGRMQAQGGLAKARIGVRSVGGMERGFIVVVCRGCKDPFCAKVCPTGALVPKEEGGVRVELDRCIGCGYCREACLIGAVFWDEETEKPMICTHCGYCAAFCPHGVLRFERESEHGPEPLT